MTAKKATASKAAAPKAAAAKAKARTPAKAKVPKEERILLPANLEMSGLEESFKLLRSKFPPKSGKCILDGAEISVVDASGIQLLINFVTSVRQKGCEVEWDNYSIQAYQLASELGVVEQLGD